MKTSKHSIWLLMGCALFLTACAKTAPKESASMKKVEGVEVTKHELETILYGFASIFAGKTDLAASDIYSSTEDPAVRRAAIEWTLNSTPEMMNACFNNDPLLGLVKAWIYLLQVREFFETGAGKDVFGPHQGIALASLDDLEDTMNKIVDEVWPSGDVDKAENFVHQWAAEHPISNMRFVIDAFNIEAYRKMGAEGVGGMAAAGAMTEQMASLNQRAAMMLPYAQRQADWQAAMIMEDSKDLVADLTDSTLVAVRQELSNYLQPTYAFIDGQRALVTDDLVREREAILEAIAAERTAILAYLQEERIEVIETLAGERDATMEDINNLTMASLTNVTEESQKTVKSSLDYVFDRMMKMMAVATALLAVLFVAVMIWVRNTTNRIFAYLETRER